jgi:ribosomal protection tetracycline resistance protein
MIEIEKPNIATVNLSEDGKSGKFIVEPLERGKGYIYESAYTTDFIFQRFQNEVEETIPKVLMEGIYGWEVTDIKVTLTGGRSINLATKPSDFRAITPIAVMDAVKSAGTVILEPMQEYEISFNPDEAGTVIKDLLNMRAEIIDQSVEGDNYIIRGV